MNNNKILLLFRNIIRLGSQGRHWSIENESW